MATPRREQRSPEAEAYRRLYKDPRWERLRQKVFVRDRYTCQRTGILLTGKHPAPNSPVANHKTPHRGDLRLFFDPDNIETVAKAVHDGEVQSEERRGFSTRVGEDGWPVDPGHILYTGKAPERRNSFTHPAWLRHSLVPLTIVCGPPASGKSTWVEQHKAPGDLLICMDTIAEAMYPAANGLRANADLSRQQVIQVLKVRNEMLGDIGRRKNAHRWPAAWFIVGEPSREKRQWWQDKLRPREIVVIETPGPVCEERVRRATRAGDARPDRSIKAITAWWTRYERREGETVVPHEPQAVA